MALSERELRERIRAVLEDETRGREAAAEPTIADPAPLGLAAFALTTFVLSCANARFLPVAPTIFVPLALFYGGLAQFLAGMWEFRNKNTFGAVAFTSYGAFWLALAFFVFFARQLGVEGSSTALGVTLFSWTVFTFYMWVGSFRTTGAVLVVFTALLATFILLDIGVLANSAIWVKIGGYCGVLTAATAWYASAAGVINHTFGRPVVPTWPLRARPSASAKGKVALGSKAHAR
jgi:succinate-acetate transporter protein